MHIWLRSHSKLSTNLTHQRQPCSFSRMNFPQNHASFNHKGTPCCKKTALRRDGEKVCTIVSNFQLSRYSSVLAFDESLCCSTDTLLFRKREHFWENKPENSFSSMPACKLSRTDADRTRVDVKMFPLWDQRICLWYRLFP